MKKTEPKKTVEIFSEKPITETLEENYMPYAMSVIISRAIPEIDGFKPSHRKLLYTMYKMGLLNGGRTKSANIVGQTMKLNPHGDAAIYETMVRLTRGHDALLHPFVDSKGNFGKHSSRNMAFAASRYTEAKLDPICKEIFADIDKDVVDFVDNYDGTLKEPSLLPTTFPNILVSANQGIAVGMASDICSFNLAEVCTTAAELIRNPDHDIITTLTAPDFTTGGSIVYDAAQMREIYETGKGAFKVRAKYRYVKQANCIEIYEISYKTTIEALQDKIIELVKQGKIKDIANVRDETDINGLKLTIDLKKNADPDKIMQKLYRFAPFTDSISCNFNVLVGGMPRVLGVKEILNEWHAFRTDCIKKGLAHDIEKKTARLHLLRGLEQILLDIDKAIRIVRETEEDSEVVPNLMIGFGIDEIQAEFVAEIKLRNLNKEYILNKIAEISALEKEIADLEATLKSKARIDTIIVKQLNAIAKQYGKPRKTDLIFPDEVEAEGDDAEDIPDYPVNIFLSEGGYFKKITPLSLRMASEQKYKDGDRLLCEYASTNKADILFFTNKFQVYKTRASEFDDTKASALGEYIPQKLGFEDGEFPLFMCQTTDYSEYLLFFFRNGKAAKIPLSSYATKTNRKKLINAYSDASELIAVFPLTEDKDFVLYSNNGKILLVNSGLISVKTTKNSVGIAVLSLRKNTFLSRVESLSEGRFVRPNAYRTKTIPAAGCFEKKEDLENAQLTLEDFE